MQTLRAYLQLCRFPAVFTAMADIVLGYMLVRAEFTPARDFWLLLGASAGLYLAGMVFNDVFDRRIDAQERPRRPIPSGRVSVHGAVVFGTVLVALGLACAALAGPKCITVAAMLTACIFLYDALLKSTFVGPVFMGSCGSLNVILGASSAGFRWTAPYGLPHVYIAAALGVYVMGVTFFARQEAGRSSRLSLTGALIVLNAGLALLLVLWYGPWSRYLSWNSDPAARTTSLILILASTFIINRRALTALGSPSPERVQGAVKVMLMSLITLDATLIYAKLGSEGVAVAAGTILLLVPSLLIGRWLYVT
jgi:4-hydroxybenzoate polyprenyltransferase